MYNQNKTIMKKLFTLLAVACSLQHAAAADEVVASFTFPDQHLTEEGSKKSGSATDATGTKCTVDYNSVGGWKNNDTPEANSVQMDGKFYQKLGSDNTKITFKLTTGSFQAGDKFTATMSRGDKTGTDGFYFKLRTTGNYKTIDYVANQEVTLEYTLAAEDINDDGTLTIARYSSNCYARHFEITRSGSGGGDGPTPTDDNALLKEYFDYTENSALEGQGGWVVSTKASEATGSSPIVISRTITYSGYDGSATGKAALFDDNQQQTTEGNSRNTLVPFITDKPAVDDVFYAAFLGDFSNTGTTSGKEIFTFIKQGTTASTGTTARGRVLVKIADGKKCFAIRKNAQTIETYSAETPKTDAALLVVKYVNKSTSSSGASDEFYLFVNPDPTKTEAENAAVKMDALGNASDGGSDLRYVCFRQTKLNAAYAGLRVARTWADAVKYKTTTAIGQVATQKAAARNEFYNLAGQRVEQPKKGLYIQNGKKVIIK